jgi:hypothetical protein
MVLVNVSVVVCVMGEVEVVAKMLTAVTVEEEVVVEY